MSVSHDPIALEALTERDAELCYQARNQMQNGSSVQACSLLLTFDKEELVTVALPNVTIPLLDALQRVSQLRSFPVQPC